MLEGLFEPLHILIILLVAIVIFGIPLLLLFRFAKWLDKRQLSRPRARVSFVGVVMGGITDVVASGILGIPLIIYVMVKYHPSRANGDSAAIVSSIHANTWLYGSQLALGLGCSVLGGYIAARIAKHDELLNGLLSSFLCTAIGICSILSGKAAQSMLTQVLLLAAAPIFALLGGFLRRAQKSSGGTPGALHPSLEGR